MGESHLMWHHFSRDNHLKIESQRHDLKPIYNKTAPAEKEINPGVTWVAQPKSRGLGRATQVA